MEDLFVTAVRMECKRGLWPLGGAVVLHENTTQQNIHVMYTLFRILSYETGSLEFIGSETNTRSNMNEQNVFCEKTGRHDASCRVNTLLCYI